MPEESSDEELMLRYRDGEAAAFETLYARHKGGTYRYILRQCGAAEIAAELHQEVWLNLVRARDRYEVTAKFSTWLYRIAHNRMVDWFRSQAARHLDMDAAIEPDETAATNSDPAHLADIGQQMAKLTEILSDLPMEQREAFILRQEAGMSLDEIAECTGTGRETVKSRLRYALNRLRDGLREAT